jgi:putative transposase
MPEGSRKCLRHYNEPGHAHELTFSCYRGLPLLSRDRTRRWFIEALARARDRCDFRLWAYVIMPEHAHVLLLPTKPDYDVAAILKSIKQPVARRATAWLRAHHPQWLRRLRVERPGGRVEHRFWQQGGGYDRNIVEPRTAWHCVHYLHENPIRRRLVARAVDWPWSSAGWYAGYDGVMLAMDEKPPDP